MTTPARRGRSLSHLLAIVTSLKHNRVVFCSMTENLDTTTRSGEFLFQVRRARAV
ncbi:recombinase family protein [Bradyrhizobium sp. CCBAU 53380]|uniref:recombinase family protein n=1 Tax=Bradyrhizobium sp. CCBAU 53380 TaxID=1325117 RepID=UPI002304900C|nr:recombinase family protein [Bradyrhizobium sp. CCBAU 53380]